MQTHPPEAAQHHSSEGVAPEKKKPKYVDRKAQAKARELGLVDIRKRVGERIRLAREAAGFGGESGQLQVARLMGYAKATQLCLFENGKRLPGIDKIAQLAGMFGCQTDYLLTLSDTMDRDPVADSMRNLQTSMQASITALMQNMAQFNLEALQKMGTSVAEVQTMCRMVFEIQQGLNRVRTLNPDMDDDTRGLAMLVGRVETAAEAAMQITNRLARAKRNAGHAMAAGRAKDIVGKDGHTLIFALDDPNEEKPA